MPDIKSLYNAVKQHNQPSTINAYTEAVNDLYENHPVDYISNLEYIITSNIGLKTLKPFIEKYGLPIVAYDYVMECLDGCLEKAKANVANNIIDTYTEAVNDLAAYKEKYGNCFNMYAYQSITEGKMFDSLRKGIANSKFGGMLIHKFSAFINAEVRFFNTLKNTLVTMVNDKSITLETIDQVSKRFQQEYNIEIITTNKNRLLMQSLGGAAAMIVSSNMYDRLKAGESVSRNDLQLDTFSITPSNKKKFIIINPDIIAKMMMKTDAESVELVLKHEYGHMLTFEKIPMSEMSKYNKVVTEITMNLLKLKMASTGKLTTKQLYAEINYLYYTRLLPESMANEAVSIDPKKLATITSGATPTGKLPPAVAHIIDNIFTKNGYEPVPSKALATTESFDQYLESVLVGNYIRSYYGFNSKCVQNRKLVKGMIDEFGESAIPDMLITADQIGESAVNQVISYLNKTYITEGLMPETVLLSPQTATFFTSLSEAVQDVKQSDATVKYLESISPYTYHTLSKAALKKYDDAYQESVRTGSNMKDSIYTVADVKAIYDFISYNEMKITMLESEDKRKQLQSEIYSLYESIDGYISESGDIEVQEEAFIGHHATGKIPSYLAKHHDMSYAGDGDISDDNSDDIEKYRRPSASIPAEEPQITNKTEPASASIVDDKDTNNDNDDDDEKDMSPAEKRAINNYYYYTYTNSNNRNTNSFNRRTSNIDNHSRNDNHSTHDNSVRDNHSVTDDHSKLFVPPDKKTVSEMFSLDINNVLGLNTLMENTHPDELASFIESSIIANAFTLTEATGDADDMKPESDHPIKDTLTDIDRATVHAQQEIKRKVQNVQNAGRALVKPVKRTQAWVSSMVDKWKDADETRAKEELADPHARSGLMKAIKYAIAGGSLAKAGLLFNPIFMFLASKKFFGKSKKNRRLRDEMIGEIKTELEILDEKIKDAGYNNNNKEKYKLMRLKNEIQKKLIRVGGTERERSLI